MLERRRVEGFQAAMVFEETQVPKLVLREPSQRMDISEILGILKERKLLSAKGRLLIHDLDTGTDTIFGKNTEPTSKNQVKKNVGVLANISDMKSKTLDTMVFICPNLSEETYNLLDEKLGERRHLARRDGSIFIFEEKNEQEDENLKIQLARKHGFAAVNVLKPRGRSFTYLEARKRKRNRGPKTPLDLTKKKETDTFDRQAWINGISRNVREIYRKCGFTVIDDSEIKSKIKATKNPPHVLSSFRLGFGVVVEATCGAVKKIYMNGDEELILKCSESDCSGGLPYEVFKEIQEKEDSSNLIEETEKLRRKRFLQPRIRLSSDEVDGIIAKWLEKKREEGYPMLGVRSEEESATLLIDPLSYEPPK